MQNIREILKSKGYRCDSSDRMWETWKSNTESGHLNKVMLPSRGNTVLFYDCRENGSPVSYTEFHNCADERQLKRFEAFL